MHRLGAITRGSTSFRMLQVLSSIAPYAWSQTRQSIDTPNSTVVNKTRLQESYRHLIKGTKGWGSGDLAYMLKKGRIPIYGWLISTRRERPWVGFALGLPSCSSLFMLVFLQFSSISPGESASLTTLLILLCGLWQLSSFGTQLHHGWLFAL